MVGKIVVWGYVGYSGLGLHGAQCQVIFHVSAKGLLEEKCLHPTMQLYS